MKEFLGIDFVKRIDKYLVYKILRADMLTTEILSQMPWDDTVRSIGFLPYAMANNDAKSVADKVDASFFCRFSYVATREQVATQTLDCAVPQIMRMTFPDKKILCDLYVKTIDDYFWKKWAAKYERDFDFMGEVKSQAENMLTDKDTIAFKKNDTAVAFLSTTQTTYLFAEGPVDWVLWVWISPELDSYERQFIRGEFAKWLRNRPNSRIIAAAEPFNPAPHKFWRRLGFNLECISVRKIK